MKISPIIIGQGGQAQIKLTNAPNVVCKILPKKNTTKSNDEINITKRFRNTSTTSNISNLIDVREEFLEIATNRLFKITQHKSNTN